MINIPYKSPLWNCARAAVLAVVAGLLLSPNLGAQQSGKILGTVTDSTGAVVPNAQITITNQETSEVRNVISGGDGFYNVPQVAPGRYTIEAMAAGFSRAQTRDVVVEVASDTRVDLKLAVGSLTQTVEVTAVAPLVDTTSSSLGSLVDESRITDLPLNGRNWTDLSLMQPGVTQVSGSGIASGNGTATLAGYNGTIFSSNGGGMRSNLYTLDGANIMNLTGFNNTSAANSSLGVDGIKEYKVVTSMFSAEYGLVMGSQTAVVSKGGTNQWHGDAFEYLRNNSMDARNYFDQLDTTNFNGFGTDKSLPFPGKRLPPYRRNNFGGAFGGPIMKDKAFFFVVFEGLKQELGLSKTGTTMAAPCFVDQTGKLQAQVPAQIENVNTLGTCVAGGPSIITVDHNIYPIIELYPFPNIVGNPGFNYAPRYVQPSNEYYGQVRGDYIFSTKDSAFVRYTHDNSTVIGLSTFPEFPVPVASASQFATLAENHVFSPTLLNTPRFSYSRTINSVQPTIVPISLATSDRIATPGQLLPGFSATPLSGVGDSMAYSVSDQDLFTWSDDLFWSKGKHDLKFGMLINHYVQYVQQNSPNGAYTASNVLNFLNNDYSSVTIIAAGSTTHFQFRYNTFGFYVQDDYRMTPRFTWNLGLRYEFDTLPHERDPALAYSLRNPLVDTTGTQGVMMTNASFHNFSPRVGFAWDPFGKGKTSIKAGSGIYYDVGTYFGGLEANNSQGNPPVTNTITINNLLPSPAIPFTMPFLVAPNQPQAPRTAEYNAAQPTMLQYNLEIQQQLPWGMGLSVAYVGSRAWHLYQTREADPVAAAGVNSAGLPNFLCWNSPPAPTPQMSAPVGANGACPSGFLTTGPKLNPAFNSVFYSRARGDSYFNSLQVGLFKQLAQGLQFQFSYTWAKNIDDGTGIATRDGGTGTIQDSAYYTEAIDRGPTIFDIRNNARANLIYHAPIIRSQGIAGKFVNGWWFSSIVSAQTGYPFTVTLSSDRQLSGGGNISERPNLDPSFNPATVIVGNPNLNAAGTYAWFNPTMFDLLPVGQLGNVGRNSLRGPGFSDVDFSAVKDTKVGFLGEAGSVQFRAEIFNILNHPNFSTPSGAVWSSGTPATAPAGEIGSAGIPIIKNAGQITTTANFSRQVQLALKVIF